MPLELHVRRVDQSVDLFRGELLLRPACPIQSLLLLGDSLEIGPSADRFVHRADSVGEIEHDADTRDRVVNGRRSPRCGK